MEHSHPSQDHHSQETRIAVVGMALRCPGAENVEEFWSNLKNGVESITIWSDEELREAGVSDSVLKLPTFVKASAPLKGLELFDAEFFGYSAREAEFIDPQHRVFEKPFARDGEPEKAAQVGEGGQLGIDAPRLPRLRPVVENVDRHVL